MQIGNLNNFGYDRMRMDHDLQGAILHPTYSTSFTIVNISVETDCIVQGWTNEVREDPQVPGAGHGGGEGQHTPAEQAQEHKANHIHIF